MNVTPTMDNLQNNKEIVDSIEKEVLEVLVECGWTKIPFSFNNLEQELEIIGWCKDNLTKNQWKIMGGSFVFRKQAEANWFILRWK